MSPKPAPGLPDGEDRALAATLFDRNLVVTAGAGTGKTALLVERILNLLGSGQESIGSVAAITFTEKAAAELRERLALGLNELAALAREGLDAGNAVAGSEAGRAYRWLRSGGGASPEEIGQRTLAALSGLDSASISTIHAFCGEILRRHPHDAGVDPAFAVDEGPEFKLQFDDEWERFLLDETGASPSREELWQRVLTIPGALQEIRTVGFRMAREGVTAPLPQDDASPDAPLRLLQGFAGQMRATISDIQSRSSGMLESMVSYLAGAAQLLDDFERDGPEGMAATASPLSLDGFLDKPGIPRPGKDLSGAPAEEVARTAREATRLLNRLSRIDQERTSRIGEAARPLAARAHGRFLSSGFASFDDMLRLARDLLAGSPSVRRRVGSRFHSILVDEFQDTDPLQYEILFCLTEEEGEPAADPWRARPAAGRLFIVGDPKQSIYRFRGADMEAYRRAVDHVLSCGGREVTLSASFRSPPGIVEPVNTLFGSLMSFDGKEDRRFEAEYRAISSARTEEDPRGPRVEIWSVSASGRSAERRTAEGDAIAGWITENTGVATATGRPLAFKDIAILMRALTHASLYALALRRAGIPHVVEGGRGFYERMEVGDLISFLRAALNPLDGAAVLAVMRSPLGGVDDAELARFAAAGGRLDGRGASPGSGCGVEGVLRTLAMLREFRSRMPGMAVDRIVEDALQWTNLRILHASSWEGSQRSANLEKLAARAADTARRGLSLEETLDFLEREYREEAAHGDAPLADETVDAVRILSVHKAKGLEYPVVILPDLGRKEMQRSGGGADAILLSRGSRRDLGIALSGGHENPAMCYHRIISGYHERAEEKRVFYVAATRASERLILVNSVAGKWKAPWRDALTHLGYEAGKSFPEDGLLDGGGVIHRNISPAPSADDEAAEGIHPGWAAAGSAWVDAIDRVTAATIPPAGSPSNAGAGDARVAESPPEPDPDITPLRHRGRPAGTARTAGVLIHEALERWSFREPAELRGLADAGLGRVDAALREPVRAEVEAILDGFLGSPLPGLLAARAADSSIFHREVPLLLAAQPGEAAEIWLGAVDLIYRDANGTWVVADYKTGRMGDDPGKEAEEHRDQLELYARGLKRALASSGQVAKVRAEVIFVRAGLCVPLVMPPDQP